MRVKLIAASLISLIILGCGGGGGGGGSSVPTSSGTAEGMWVGTSTTGYGVATLILENAETWGFYYSGSTTYGVFNGVSSGSGNSFSASGTELNFSTQSSASSSLSGTVIPQTSITASSNSGFRVNLIYDNSYNTPASLSAVAGNYTGWGMTKTGIPRSISFNISSTGAITATDINCVVSGNISPRSSGKNVYNISTTFTGVGCVLGNGVTTTGVGTIISSGSLNRLIIMTLNSSKTDGYIVNGYTAGIPNATATVPAQTAVANWMRAANTQYFNLTTTNGCLGTLGSVKTDGTSQSAIFEGAARNYSTTTTSIAYSNCTPATSTGVERVFTNSSYIPIGYQITSGSPFNDAFYGVYTSGPNIPVNLTAGASGTYGTISKYTNSSKTTSAGRTDVTYTSSAETSLTLKLNLVFKNYDASNQLNYTEINTFRITTGGVATLLGGEITYANGVVATFR